MYLEPIYLFLLRVEAILRRGGCASPQGRKYICRGVTRVVRVTIRNQVRARVDPHLPLIVA